MTIPTNNHIRCQNCLAEFYFEAPPPANMLMKCPNCGLADIMPLKVDQDLYVKINWQDLRLLAIYAQRWVATFDTTNKVDAMYKRITHRIINELSRYKDPDMTNLDPSIQAPQVQEQIEARRVRGIPSPFFSRKPPEDGYAN